jgi:tRNA threonylcarbamoyladenosine biosynthesis protein TsaE
MKITYRLSEIDAVSQQIMEQLTHDCVLIEAPMGAGKTTLIKSLCKNLGVVDEVSSPTFSLVNEYKTATGEVLHFDLYRIEQAVELHEIGMEDYLDRKALKFIEWPEMAMPLIEEHHFITIKIIDEDQREVSFA